MVYKNTRARLSLYCISDAKFADDMATEGQCFVHVFFFIFNTFMPGDSYNINKPNHPFSGMACLIGANPWHVSKPVHSYCSFDPQELTSFAYICSICKSFLSQKRKYLKMRLQNINNFVQSMTKSVIIQ